MAESTLSLTTTRLRRIIGRDLGYGTDPSLWTSTRAYQATEVKDAIDDALCQFYGAHEWSFLKIPLSGDGIPIYAPYETGTVAVASGVVTLTSGTFPSWAADGDFIYDIAYSVATRDGNTQITLNDTSVTVSSGASYSLVQSSYTLPDDFGGFIGSKLLYRPGDDNAPSEIDLIDPDQIWDLRRHYAHTTDRPRFAAVQPKANAGTSAGQRMELLLAPAPNEAGRITARYRPITDTLSDSIVYPYGGGLHSSTIIAICRHVAQLDHDSYDGRHGQRYQELLERSIAVDSGMFAPDSLGYDHGGVATGDTIDDHRAWSWPYYGPGTLDQ